MSSYKDYFNPEPKDAYKKLKVLVGLILLLILLFKLTSCSVLKTETVTVYDSVRVVKYDTTKETIETLDFLNKTIEVYDTVHLYDTNRHKIVVPFIVRREKIEYGSATKTETKKGTGSDSARVESTVKENVKKKRPTGSIVSAIVILGLFFLGMYWIKNKK